LLGAPEFCDGDLLIETVYRFKGQAAACVVLTEVDFAQLDELVQRKLFVGMTRASMKLILVLSERAAGVLADRSG
jgi:superfamily I DNA and RNA helicase